MLKDEIVGRGKVYYAKLARGKTMFLAPRMIPVLPRHLGRAPVGGARALEPRRAGDPAGAPQGVGDEHGGPARGIRRERSQAFTRGVDELQAAMIVVPSEVFYEPKFTYIWTLGVGRFPDALRRRVSRDTALREIARCFLAGAGMTIPGELARVTGLSRPEAGRGNRALVAEGYATTPATGVYHLAARPGVPAC